MWFQSKIKLYPCLLLAAIVMISACGEDPPAEPAQDPVTGEGPVLNENERVSLATMIDAYTINGAWLMHQEDRVGSIEVGKRADIVVLDRNLFAILADQISEARVLFTLLDGVAVYTARNQENASE